MSVVSMKQLLEAGVHFGHQTRRWNPKMAEYIYCERNGIYIIDLQKTVKKLEDAYNFVRTLSENNGTILFVGTKKQAADAIKEEASRVGMEELTALPGVGRKTANLILGDIFKVPGSTVVDTHCIRISNRLGLVDGLKEPEKIEMALRKILPPDKSSDFCHRIVLHGRAVCRAQKPDCENCCVRHVCRTYEEK